VQVQVHSTVLHVINASIVSYRIILMEVGRKHNDNCCRHIMKDVSYDDGA